ncbi:hypothetical protein [Schleiferilactobacillus harbinensis]|uniref:Uncharacterized protein n=1 Tax=Schleiferilactobacillus harbinensis TaxID=304207 RepID=A0A5P8M401_9LACO|nr:hypothetical protein [Schleiferilactobacillus harbinensis]QFR23216.1 hypothetical protein D1010_07275 [Schleiferilactobacillus harbinensis]
MIKAIRRPKEYTVIKVPTDCKDVGFYVAQETKQIHVPMDISTDYTTDGNQTAVNGWTVQPGDAIVIDTEDLSYSNSVHVFRPDEYAKHFEEKPDVVSIDDGTVISGDTFGVGSETHIQLGKHIYATIGPNGLTVTDTGDGTAKMCEFDRVLKDLATALNQEGRAKLD